MVKSIEGILLFSENPKKLADFYINKIGFKLTNEFEYGEKKDSVYYFEFPSGGVLTIMVHNKVKGKNKNPERYIVNFEVDDIKKEFARLKKEGVNVIAEIYHIESYGWVATFEDIDGNYFQLVQVRPN